MKIVFCWSDISGYMATCWKALAAIPEVELHIFAFGNNDQTNFNLNLTESLNINYVERQPDYQALSQQVIAIDPYAIVLCGWFVPAYRKLGSEKRLRSSTRLILAMDTPWWGTIRQHIGTIALRGFLRKMDAVVTSGERSYQYARRLGAKKIAKIQYGVNVASLKLNLQERVKGQWPKRFLFVGRYAPEKGINELIKAYGIYRISSSEPWELYTCGKGPLENVISGVGITNHGFVQPEDMQHIWKSAGCLILPSSFDPWPLIVVEACAAGLPVICTHASGSQVEVVKMYWNGLIIEERNPKMLVWALDWIANHYDHLSLMGARSIEQAAPYEAREWATKILELINSME